MPQTNSVVQAIRSFASGIKRPSTQQVAEPDWETPADAQSPPPPPTVLETIRSHKARLAQTQARRILVVEDDPSVRGFVVRVLRDAGYVVMAADGGPEALHIIRDGAEFDLIVSDVRMPVMSGPDFIEHLRKERPGTTVLYLTGYHDSLFKDKTVLTDKDAYLSKPASVKGILEAVSLLLCGHVLPADPS